MQQNEITEIKIGFLRQGLSLAKYCELSGIDRRNAMKTLTGKWKGKKANALKNKIILDSGVHSEFSGNDMGG
jgi:hypothetical protein